MTFETLDVVVVPFPFTERKAAKRRPAMIVSSETFHRAHKHSILAMITSAASEWPSDVAIHDWQQAGLHVPCKVRYKLFTLDDRLFVRKLGTLSRRDGKVVRETVGRVLAGSE